MNELLNTGNPILIILSVLLTAGIILLSKRSMKAWPIMIWMLSIIGLLIFHSISLDRLNSGSELISEYYHCIAVDLILILLTFISYLWVDDIIAKVKKLKSYDDSLCWFWHKF